MCAQLTGTAFRQLPDILYGAAASLVEGFSVPNCRTVSAFLCYQQQHERITILVLLQGQLLANVVFTVWLRVELKSKISQTDEKNDSFILLSEATDTKRECSGRKEETRVQGVLIIVLFR